MEQIAFTPLVLNKLDGLVELLYNKEYFSYLETSEAYVAGIYSFIKSIPLLKHHATKNKRHGTWYCSYKPNKHTNWYITFDKENEFYIIRNIFNNHTGDYPAFIRGLK